MNVGWRSAAVHKVFREKLRSRVFETKNFEQAKIVHSAAKLRAAFFGAKNGESSFSKELKETAAFAIGDFDG